MGRRPSAIEAAALSQLAVDPHAVVPGHIRVRLERYGWLAAGSGLPVTDLGMMALTDAVRRPPKPDGTTIGALAMIANAAGGELYGYWPSTPTALAVARLLELVSSEPRGAGSTTQARWTLSEKGRVALADHRAHLRPSKAMTNAHARAVRAVAEGAQQRLVDADTYRECHSRGWLRTLDDDDRSSDLVTVAPKGWAALIAHHASQHGQPLLMPARALAPGLVIRLADPVMFGTDPVCVVEVARVTESAQLLGYAITVVGGCGLRQYPSQQPVPPDADCQVLAIEPPTLPGRPGDHG